MALVGLKNFYYAGMTKDEIDGTDTVIQYATPSRIIGINSIDINPTVNKATLYGDDSALATASSLGEIEVTIDVADIPLKDLAFLLGHTYDATTNTMSSKGGDKAPYVAIMFESDKHDGKTRYIKLLKGRFSDSQETVNTRGDSVEFQLPQISGTFVTREADKEWKRTYDQTGTDTTVASNWYKYVDGSETAKTLATTSTESTGVTFLGQ